MPLKFQKIKWFLRRYCTPSMFCVISQIISIFFRKLMHASDSILFKELKIFEQNAFEKFTC